MPQVSFHCPRCNTRFPVLLQDDQYSCPECGSSFRLLHSGRGVAWVSNDQGPLWKTSMVHPVSERFILKKKQGEQVDQAIGAAQARQLQRHYKKSQRRVVTLGFLLIALSLLVLATPLFNPLVRAIASSAEDLFVVSQAFTPQATQLPLATLPPPATATATPTATALPPATSTPAPSLTPTATQLPPELVVATAWQATLDRAVVRSHAMQTANAIEYRATQTALPPILTAMAEERSVVATQTAQAQENRD